MGILDSLGCVYMEFWENQCIILGFSMKTMNSSWELNTSFGMETSESPDTNTMGSLIRVSKRLTKCGIAELQI
jgi:hypothetical protein